jgi:hypothetical protein
MQRLSPKKTLTLWILIGIILIAGSTFATFLLKKRIAEARVNIIDARVNIALSSQQKQNLSALTQQYDKIRADSKKLNNAFYDRTKPLVFVDRLEALAAEFKITEDEPTVAEPSRTKATGNLYSIEEKSFSVIFHGTAANLLTFLTKFDAEPYYILIDTVTFQQSTSNEVTLELRGIIPWY